MAKVVKQKPVGQAKTQEPKPANPVCEEKAMEERLLNALPNKIKSMFIGLAARLGAGANERKDTPRVGEQLVTKKNKKHPAKQQGKEKAPKTTFAEVAKKERSSGGPVKAKANESKTKPKSSKMKTTPDPLAWSVVTKKCKIGEGKQNKEKEGKGGENRNPPKGNGTERTEAKPKFKAETPAKKAGQKEGQSRSNGTRDPSKRKLPRSAAITITSLEGGYEDLLRKARSKISLQELGIVGRLRPKRAQTGALIIEVPGKDREEKADLLAERLSGLFVGHTGVKVSRPMKTGEIRVIDLENSATTVELAEAVARAGGCAPTGVTVGPLRRGTNGLNTAWIRCPLGAIKALTSKGNKLQVG